MYRQFNGPFDYTSFGNTLNIAENGANSPCTILTTSSADFFLEPNQEIEAAFLYWAGSGPGDFSVKLNNISISAERTFNLLYTQSGTQYIYFAAFADITQILRNNGNGNYTLSDLDLRDVIAPYCSPPGSGTNFGGWAVTVVYKDLSLPNNQVNIFDGLESVDRNNQVLQITLDNLQVMDTEGAKIGFLAWEGDRAIAVNETLRINGHILSNYPLNPADNAFNGTNSFTNSDVLYNMDIDFYSISNYINVGDTSANIQLTSGQDFVMINNIVTVLNSQLPDATISIGSVMGQEICDNRELTVAYTVSNLNSTAPLPAATPIAFYANDILVAQAATQDEIDINASEEGVITFEVPQNTGLSFTLKAVVDDIGDGTGIVRESNEENNEFEIPIRLFESPQIPPLNNLETCEIIGDIFFDLTEATAHLDPRYNIQFFLTYEDAENNTNAISDPEHFQSTENPQNIFVRVDNEDCFIISSFSIQILDCPLPDATIDFPEVTACWGRNLLLPFTVYNLEATGPLPAYTPIVFYADDIPLSITYTQTSIPIGGSETNEIELELPENLDSSFILKAIINQDLDGNMYVEELRMDNNSFSRTVNFETIPPIPNLPNLKECDEGFGRATFDLTVQNPIIHNSSEGNISYYTSLEKALANSEPIENPSQYNSIENPQTIYVRLETEICFTTASFILETEKCKPLIPQGFSPNNDGINDVFEISNLLNIYDKFELKIYSRNGNLIYTGNNQDGFWDGVATQGLLFKDHLVPVGTYYYVLILNDSRYPKPFIGWVYVNY